MEIKATEFGRGVFATLSYKVGDLVEVSPVIVLSSCETSRIDETILYNYYYSWGSNDDQAAIALGYGSLFNHSYTPNAKYVKNQEDNTIQFIAIKQIKKGAEILINYNGDPTSKAPLWFDVNPVK